MFQDCSCQHLLIYLIDAQGRFKSQFLRHLLPHILVRDSCLAAQLVDDLEETVQVHLTSVNHWGAVDGGSTVFHVLVEFGNLEKIFALILLLNHFPSIL